MNAEKLYPIVNSHDQIIGYKTKAEAYQTGAMLRSVQVFVFDRRKRLFIQKRSAHKKRYPNYWCASTAGHVEPGESYEEAARRELKEELNITAQINLCQIKKTAVGVNCWAMMAHYTASNDQPITLDSAEITDGRYVSQIELQEMIECNESFTPSFMQFYQIIIKNGQTS